MNSSIDVGVFGGTFNPIHNAHLTVAEKAKQQFELGKVIFVPSKTPPHKRDQVIPSVEHRYNMVELAITGINYMEISSIEMERSGPSYTIDTLKEMETDFGRIAFIVGADNLIQIETWKEPEALLTICPFLVAPRRGYGVKDFQDGIFQGKDLRFLEMEEISISSTEIREKYRDGATVDHLVPPSVRSYIEEKGLYTPASFRV